MALKIAVKEQRAGAYLVTLDGRLDTESAPQYDKALAPVLDTQPRSLQLDLARLDYVSSMGLRALVKSLKAVKAGGGKFGVVNVQPQIKKIFDIAAALPAEAIFGSVAEADAYFDSIQRPPAPNDD
jgi:anti-anti-sigma factor